MTRSTFEEPIFHGKEMSTELQCFRYQLMSKYHQVAAHESMRVRQLTVRRATDLVIGLVPVLDAQVVGVQLHLEVRKQQLLLDQVPDDPGHFVAQDVDNRSSLDLLRHFDLVI